VSLESARRRDGRFSFSRQASVPKPAESEAAMKVTTYAVQVLGGGAGYVREFPVARQIHRAEEMQIFEETEQIQRLEILRHAPTRAGENRLDGACTCIARSLFP
jgi:alkylation response protein AidB-like acyl-CoA dehydrogenase